MVVDGQTSIESIYNNLLPGNGFKLDTKTSKYWTNAISKGDKTYDDFKDYVVRGQDYANYIRSVFVDVYYELAPCFTRSDTADVHEMFENMMKAKEGDIVSRADIKYFISNTPSFRDGLTLEIVRVYTTVHGYAPGKDVVQHFEEKFLNDAIGTYSLEQLEDDISQHQQQQHSETKQLVNDSMAGVGGVTTSDYKEGSKSDHSYSRDNEGIIALYENVVGRNMSAREFVLFVADLAAAKDKAALAKSIDVRIQKHLVHVQDIIHRFLDIDLDRDAFIHEHLIPAFSNDDYGNTLQRDIVLSESYEQKMTAKIKQLHDTMYGEQMVEEDCSYLFNRIRDRQLGIMNEDLNRLIAEFKKETDEIIQRVFDIYMEVYEREPEDDELNGHVTFMRMSTDKNIAEATVKSGLRSALEYHDVLKKRIKKAHAALHAQQTSSAAPITQSHIFRILDKILPYKDRDDIDSLISQYL
jgi:cell division protein FtsB